MEIPLLLAVLVGLAGLFMSVTGATQEAENIRHVADDDYEPQRSWWWMGLTVVVLIVFLGMAGLGPLAGAFIVR